MSPILSSLAIYECFHLVQIEEERQKQKERRKKDRQKLLNKKRSLDGLVKDAEKRANDFERKVNIIFGLYHSESFEFSFLEGTYMYYAVYLDVRDFC